MAHSGDGSSGISIASGDGEGTKLTGTSTNTTDLDIQKCIICQVNTKQQPTSSGDGRKRLRDAADVRNDHVLKRLKTIQEDVPFVYHVSNPCYKSYTHKLSLSKIKQDHVSTTSRSASETADTPCMRSKSTPRSAPTLKIDIYKQSCVVCGFVKHKNVYEKCRISEMERADKFLKATVFFQDNVYTRTCDLDSVPSVFGADLYCHKDCIRRYIKAYDDRQSSKCSEQTFSPKLAAWSQVSVKVREGLSEGVGFDLSDIRDMVNQKLTQENHIRNRETKILLVNEFGEEVMFTQPQSTRQSSMVYSKQCTTNEMASSIRDSDPIKTCAEMIRTALLDIDFGLQDKFCDSNELETSWNSMVLPTPLARFFSVLFNVDMNSCLLPAKDMMKAAVNDDNDDDDATSKLSSVKCRQMLALFQIIHYDLHSGRKKTPLHIMNSEIIHDTCKSSTLITSFNRFGLCMSYDELMRYHNDMALYTIENSNTDVPIPSHIDPGVFTTAAIDNFDHEEASLSGIGGSHDSVTVLFQKDSGEKQGKPNMSHTHIKHGAKTFNHDLPCQRIQEYFRPTQRPSLPASFSAPEELYSIPLSDRTLQAKKDMAWLLSRFDLEDLKQISSLPEIQTMPSWSAANSVWTKENLKQKNVGFLPILPNPITEHRTVYTTMKNLVCLLGQLHQPQLAVACDEGVYCIAREIKMIREDEFKNLILCMGSFHITKVVLSCIGKYLRGSGAESIWIESGAFGVNVVQSVLSGKHYVRSLKGMMMLSEALHRLQWEEFFAERDNSQYHEVLTILKKLKQHVEEKKFESSQELMQTFLDKSDTLRDDFFQFVAEGRRRSETFMYWDNFLEMVSKLMNLVRSDREGNWSLHLDTIQQLMGLFAAMDATNYFRWCSLYIEDMRQLPATAPDVHTHFQEGHFVVKRTPGNFKAVAMDMCLEQTINRSQKSASGIIGSTRQKKYVAEWELIFHEMLAVNHLHRVLSGVKSNAHELLVNHEFTKCETECGEQNVQAMMEYIKRHENPFIQTPKESQLHNILTQEVMSVEIREQLLQVNEIGNKRYAEFRQDRLVQKTVKLSDTIHRSNLKTFKNIHDKAKKSSCMKTARKDYSYAQRVIDIARARGHMIDYLLQYDIVPVSSLFEEDGLMTKTVKSGLVTELEKSLSTDDYQPYFADGNQVTAYIVDVMANVRKVGLKDISTFGDLCKSTIGMIKKNANNADRIDLVFDSYREGTIKDSERERRRTIQPIEHATIDSSTILPVQMDRFWSSSKNKLHLEALIHQTMVEMSRQELVAREVVIGKVLNEPMYRSVRVSGGNVSPTPELDLEHDEADTLLVVHAVHAVEAGASTLVILTADSDVVVLMLYFCHDLQQRGLQELWVKAGISSTVRYIPIHTMVTKLGHDMCNVLPAVHVLTGCDYTSKFGTKLASLKAEPTQHLTNFGISRSEDDFEAQIIKAEQFLVQVLHRGSSCTTMNDLRTWMYHSRKGVTVLNLPPTSESTRAHILRSYYVTNLMRCLLADNAPVLNPQDYGYKECDGLLLPVTSENPIPDSTVQCCTCKKCATVKCACRIARLACCRFCKCQSQSRHEILCKNPIQLDLHH